MVGSSRDYSTVIKRVAGTIATAALIGGAGVAPADAYTPPPGTPDLSQAVLQPGDFSQAGNLVKDSYSPPDDRRVTASYVREFDGAVLGKARFLGAKSDVKLITDAGTAASLFQDLRTVFQSRRGRAAFVAAFFRGFNRSAHGHPLRARDVHFLRPRNSGVGDDSFVLPMRITWRGVVLAVDIVLYRVDRGIGTLELAALKTIPVTDELTLVRAGADHMRALLAPPPPAPPSG